MKRILPILILIIISLSGCFITDFFRNLGSKPTPNMNQTLPTKQIILQTSRDSYPLIVELANSDAERENGLMNRDKVDEGKGMLFSFPDEAPRQFWMKNTKMPLDIIFFNGKKEVVHVVENMVPCTTPQCVSYSSEDPAMYALEVRSGFVRAYGVKNGDKMIDAK